MKGYTRLHAIAHCRDCDWIEEGYLIAPKLAIKHHKETGHGIDIELGFWREIKRRDAE